jgi:hypothetical protein
MKSESPAAVFTGAGCLEPGREEESLRFELMKRNLPPVRSEKQLIADALIAQQQMGKVKDNDQGRAR